MPKNNFDINTVPAHFKKLIEDYGFEDEDILKNALACRSASGWYAILFVDKQAEELYAVDFKYYGPGEGQHGIQRVEGWEIQNDNIGPFDSVKEFLTTKLTQSFF